MSEIVFEIANTEDLQAGISQIIRNQVGDEAYPYFDREDVEVAAEEIVKLFLRLLGAEVE